MSREPRCSYDRRSRWALLLVPPIGIALWYLIWVTGCWIFD